jgi:RNA polymerase sigma-70 factor, ECF subfamily
MPDQASLVEPHIPGLRRFSASLLRGDWAGADALVLECLEQALSQWRLCPAEGDLRCWLYTILYQRYLSDVQRRKPRGSPEALLEIDEASPPGAQAEQVGGERWDLLRAFATLTEEQRLVLLLVAVEDFSYAEAAQVLSVPIGTVMSRLSRGRRRLRQQLERRLWRPGRDDS